jgi:hypothetical protein
MDSEMTDSMAFQEQYLRIPDPLRVVRPRAESPGGLVELQLSVVNYGSKPHSVVQVQLIIGLNTETGSRLARGSIGFLRLAMC